LIDIVEQLKSKRVGFRSFNDGGIDTTTASSEMIFNIFPIRWRTPSGYGHGDKDLVCTGRRSNVSKRSEAVNVSKKEGFLRRQNRATGRRKVKVF
jgi:hypothetical protein